VWARVASVDAGAERGLFIRPEIGDEVVVGFIESDPRYPVLLGMLHSSANPAPQRGSNDNHVKLYQSRSKLCLRFDDDKKTITLETPGGQKLLLDDEAKGITLSDQHGNKIVMDANGIAIESAKAFGAKTGTGAKLDVGTNFELKASAQVRLEGSGGVDVSSSGSPRSPGSLVKIN